MMTDGSPKKTGCDCYISLTKSNCKDKETVKVNVFIYNNVAKEFMNLPYNKYAFELNGDGKLYFMPATKTRGITPRLTPDKCVMLNGVGNKKDYANFAGTYMKLHYDSKLETFYVQSCDRDTFYKSATNGKKDPITYTKKPEPEVVEPQTDEKTWVDKWNELGFEQNALPVGKNPIDPRKDLANLVIESYNAEREIIRDSLYDSLENALDKNDISKAKKLIKILRGRCY